MTKEKSDFLQKILYISQMESYLEFMDPKVIRYIKEQQTEAFESFENFNLLAFDWYDITCDKIFAEKIMIYMDREDLFFLCENSHVYDKVNSLVVQGQSNERVLYMFFVGLLKNDMSYLDKFETDITNTEDEALSQSGKDYLDKIVEYRKELLRLKRYYEQLSAIFDNLTANDNGIISKDGVRHLLILSNRILRFHSSVLNIRDYITQMREAYQAQIDIEQNKIMKIFTLITAVFLPLTLLVGWYGMNFKNMPELSWEYGYAVMILISLSICVFLLAYFKRKKWF